MSGFNIDYDDGRQMTFSDLLALQEEGYSVARSPHMPLNTANLGVAMLGLKVIAYEDSTSGSADADREHAEFVSDVVTAASIQTWEDYVAHHRELYRTVIDIAVEQTALECNLATMFVAEALDSGKNRVYHLGGRDMERYLPAKTDAINALIGALQKDGVIGDLGVTVLTVAGTKIVGHKSEADQLNEFWDLVISRDADANREKKRLLQRDDMKAALSRTASITDLEVLGGEGVAITERALDVPIKAMRHTLRKFQ